MQRIQYAGTLQDHTIVLVSEAMLRSMALADVSAKLHAVCIDKFYYLICFILQSTSHAKMEGVALIFAHLLTVVHSVPVQRVII